MSESTHVGVRELRQNLSVYLKAVRERGEAYVVTDHGHPVALLTPLPTEPLSVLERLIAEGKASQATGDILDIEPLAPIKGKQVSQILIEMREEERY